jgi:hypothetical protein
MKVLKFIWWGFFGFVAVMLIMVSQPRRDAEMLSPARRIEPVLFMMGSCFGLAGVV